MEEFSDQPRLHMQFHVGRHFVDCSSAAICCTATKLKIYWQEVSTSTVISPASASNIMGKHNKIGGIALRAPLVVYSFHSHKSVVTNITSLILIIQTLFCAINVYKKLKSKYPDILSLGNTER
jgi:hypothetical protein